MDQTRYLVRPFADADYDAEARLVNAINPEFPVTVDELRQWDRSGAASPDHLLKKYVVEDRESGEVVGAAQMRHNPHAYHPQKFQLSVQVVADHRHRGIGRELFETLEEESGRRRAIRLWSNFRGDDERSARFAARNGFVVARKVWLSRLDLASARLDLLPDRSAELLAQGYRFTTLAAEGADRPDVRKRFYRLRRLTSADVPRLGEYTPISFDEFLAQNFGAPGMLPDCVFLAAEGDEFVAESSLERELAATDSLRIGFTGTDPRARGRGLASELKRRAVLRAREMGYRYLRTVNDSLNRPIWAINEKMGFRQEVTWVQCERAIEDPPPAATGRPTSRAD